MTKKILLLVDDSEIDRSILKNILSADFDILEADNGYSALKIILGGRPRLDALLMDISMPVLGGFDVLRIMQEKQIENLPVVLVTANATKEIVHQALAYKVKDFIGKPFDAKIVLEKMSAIVDIKIDTAEEAAAPRHILTEEEIEETKAYASKLRKIFKRYAKLVGKDDEHYVRASAVMEILLTEYAAREKIADLDTAHIEMIGQAAYFMDIGFLGIPSEVILKNARTKSELTAYEKHTTAGAELVWLNPTPECRYFVKMCEDLCMHHHERFDGTGYPHNLNGNDNSIYAQLCGLSHRFDKLFTKNLKETSEMQFEYAMKRLRESTGEFSSNVLSILNDSRYTILFYYKNYISKKK